MHKNVIVTFGLIVYFMTLTVGLEQFAASLYVSLILLLGVPILLLARFSAAPSPVLVAVSAFGMGLALLLEGAAHAYGLWYLSNPTGVSVLGWLTPEMLIITAAKVVFLVLFYELLFDDGLYTVSHARARLAEFGLFALSAMVLVSVLNVVFDSLAEPSAYYWISMSLLLSGVGMLLVRRSLTARLFDKVVHFVVVAALPMLCVEFLLIANGFKTVLSVAPSVGLPFTSLSLPLGEVLLALTLPALVMVVYELYVDDQL